MGLFDFLKGNGKENLKEINVSEDIDFVDLKFTITKYSQDEFKNHILEINGLFKNMNVGLLIALRPDMELGFVNDEIDNSKFYKQGVNFYSIGETSDNFIKALINLYGFNISNAKMNDRIETTTFVLSGNPINIKNDFIKTKIFFDDENEIDCYSELYVNINLKNRTLELREKDSEYRENLIKVLSK